MNTFTKFLTISITTATIALCGATFAHAGVTKDDGYKPLAKCKSGATWYSRTGQHGGACSGNGGVATWLDGSKAPAPQAPVKASK